MSGWHIRHRFCRQSPRHMTRPAQKMRPCNRNCRRFRHDGQQQPATPRIPQSNLLPNGCFLPWAQYDAFWVQQITTASGFAKPRRVRRRLGAQALAPLGSEVITTLKARGYDPLFTFWHRPLAETRGIIYLQTRAGPVRLLDASPSTRKATQFPVHAQTLDGAALLTLSTADSVPKRRFVLRTFGRTQTVVTPHCACCAGGLSPERWHSARVPHAGKTSDVQICRRPWGRTVPGSL